MFGGNREWYILLLLKDKTCYRKEVSKCRILGNCFRKVYRGILPLSLTLVSKARSSSFIASIVTLWRNIMLRYTKKVSDVFCEYLFLWVVYVFVTWHVKIKKKRHLGPTTVHCQDIQKCMKKSDKILKFHFATSF